MNKKNKNLSDDSLAIRILKKLELHRNKILLNILFLALIIVTLMLYIWSIPSIYYLMPWMWLKITASISFAITVPAALIWIKSRRKTFFIISILVLVLTIWQQAIPPSNDRDWKIPVARLPLISIKGNDIKIANIRNFDYRSVSDFTPSYYSKSFQLNKIDSMNYILSYWDDNKAIAHCIFSFGFENGDHLAVSVETRLSKGHEQSLLGGLFNQYELIYILADERDIIRLRTNFRKEQVYLYQVKLNKVALQKVFLRIIERAADLNKHPRFYNTIKHNCLTTLLADLRRAQGKQYHFDYRLIMNGYSDKLLYDNNIIISDSLPFSALKKRQHINQYIESDPNAKINFSKKIRPKHSEMKNP